MCGLEASVSGLPAQEIVGQPGDGIDLLALDALEC
jgi:hypothetical protein